MTIPQHRQAIDKLDAQIIRLLNERTQHVLQIGQIKIKAGESIYVPHRERVVMQRICKLNQGPIKDASLRAIYREIMSGALALEKSMTIAYLGPEATFTHQAALQRRLAIQYLSWLTRAQPDHLTGSQKRIKKNLGGTGPASQRPAPGRGRRK